MARARNIKPSFFTNEDLAELVYEARLLFVGTWCLSDREGRLEDRPKKIKMAIFPADSLDVNKLLQQLHESKFLLRYEVDGKRYIQVMKFLKHQNPHHREPASTLPAAPESLILEWLGNRVGPEACDLFKQAEALGSPRASRADSGFLNPDSPSRIPDPGSPLPEKKPSAAARRLIKAEPGRTVPTWKSYSSAYLERWGVEPTQNRRVNGQMAQFVDMVPIDEAPDIAAFYVSSNRGLYVSAKHPINLLLRDAEALRTEWLTGRQGTESEARQADRTAATGSLVDSLLADKRRAA